MGLFAKLKGLFSTAGYPAIGGTFEPRIEARNSYYESMRSNGYAFDGSKWSNGLGSTGRGPVIDHATMRANARSAMHDSTAARAIVDRYEQSVVDVGVRIECTPNAELLGITPDRAERWAADVEDRFHLWASSKLATAAEDMSFYQAQRFTMRSRKRDGEYFIRCYYDSRRDLLNPLRIGFIDPNQIQGDALTDTSWPRTAIDGITRDDRGRETEYTVLIQQKDGKVKYEKIPAHAPKTNLPIILHAFAPEYAGQSRGFSAIGHAIQEFENLTDFTAAQIKKAIIQSSITMWVEPSDSAPALNPFADIGSGPSSAFEAPIAPSTSGSTYGGDTVNYSRVNEANLRPGSIGVFNLQEGSKLNPFQNTAPSESYSSFVDAFMGHLAASCNIPPELVDLKFSSNYSASRAALIMFWRTACIERDEEASDFYNPIFRAWLSGEIAAGRIAAPGWSDPRMRAAWCSCTWNGPPMPNIDPAKTAKADKDYVELGAQTLDTVARNYNGSSGAANRAKLTRQLEQLPVPPWAAKPVAAPAFGASPAEPDQESPEDDNVDGEAVDDERDDEPREE